MDIFSSVAVARQLRLMKFVSDSHRSDNGPKPWLNMVGTR
jgi:hypothetical protein